MWGHRQGIPKKGIIEMEAKERRAIGSRLFASSPEFRTAELPWPGSTIGADQEGKRSLRGGHHLFTTQAIRDILKT